MTSNRLFQSAYPTDLRGISPLEAGGGKIYPVDPEAAQRLREFHEQKAREKEVKALAAKAAKTAKTAKTAAKSKSKGKVIMNNKIIEPVKLTPEAPTAVADLYSAEARAAAAVEFAKDPVKRRYGKVLTPEVLDIWSRWVDEGKATEWIAENNGLVPVANETVRAWLKRHQDGKVKGAKTAVSSKPPKVAKRTVLAVPVVPEKVEPVAVPVEVEPEPVLDQTPTAGAEPVENGRFVATKPENLPAFLDKDNRPAPRPLDGLASLLQLINSDHVKVKGSVKLNLEVEFGGDDSA